MTPRPDLGTVWTNPTAFKLGTGGPIGGGGNGPLLIPKWHWSHLGPPDLRS